MFRAVASLLQCSVEPPSAQWAALVEAFPDLWELLPSEEAIPRLAVSFEGLSTSEQNRRQMPFRILAFLWSTFLVNQAYVIPESRVEPPQTFFVRDTSASVQGRRHDGCQAFEWSGFATPLFVCSKLCVVVLCCVVLISGDLMERMFVSLEITHSDPNKSPTGNLGKFLM